MGPRLTPRHLLDQFWEGLGRIWGGFGEGLGRNFEGFGRFCVGFGQILDAFGKMWPCCGKAYKLDPRADPRSVTMRGGPRPLQRDRTELRTLWSLVRLRSKQGPDRAKRRPATILTPSFLPPFARLLKLCWAIFHNFWHFFAIFLAP